MIRPVDTAELQPIFVWDSLNEIGPHTLPYDLPVAGTVFEVQLTSGAKVHVWRAENGQEYFCHGLSFGGKEAPGGPISPFGIYVPTILQGHYEMISRKEPRPGDILVWRGLDFNDIVHSAILTSPVLGTGQDLLDYSTRLQTKNGIEPETNMTLQKLIENHYGESYNVYRRK